MSAYELLIFDFDGTIADSEAVILDTMRYAFEIAGATSRPDAEVRSRIGLDLHEMVRVLLADEAQEARVDEVAGLYRDKWIAEAHQRITLFEGIESLLQSCNDRGQELTIATGKSRIGLERSLEAHDLGHFFTAWATPDQVENGKPAPDMIEFLLATRPYDRSRVLVIGDSTLDLEMGHTAQVHTCAVAWGTNSEESLRAAGPNWFVPTMGDLAELLGR